MVTHKDADPRPQLDRFKDLARELECDESEEAFDERLRKVAGALKTRMLWKLDWAKADGFTLHPLSGQPVATFPIWRTQDEGRAWLAAHGYQMVDDDPDTWAKDA